MRKETLTGPQKAIDFNRDLAHIPHWGNLESVTQRPKQLSDLVKTEFRRGNFMQTWPSPSFRSDLLIGRIPLLPGVDLIVVLTETMGQQRLDIRTWAKGDDGHRRPTSTGFRLNSNQMGVFAHLISEATRLTIAEGELVDPEQET